MDSKTPLVLAGAQYASKADAVKDFHILWGARHIGESDHLSVAVLSKDLSGKLQIDRHNSTANTDWSAPMLSAALALVAPGILIPLPEEEVGTIGERAHVEEHLRRTMNQEELDQISEIVRSGESGVCIVAVDRTGSDVQALLTNALRSVIVEAPAGDLDAVLEQAHAAG